jgi:hypothetical protein
MAFILAAPIMNLAYDRMSKTRMKGDGSEMLPDFMVTLYNMGGKDGVALLLIITGVTILVAGHFWQQIKTQSTGTAHSSSSGNAVAQLLRESSADEPEQAPPTSGQMVMKTGKYF